MSAYDFYYDESEHSRSVNYKTVSAPNYYDNFITAIVGWSKDSEKAIFENYADFENKYADRNSRKLIRRRERGSVI